MVNIVISLEGEKQVLNSLEKRIKALTYVEEWLEKGEADKVMNDSFAKNFESQGRPKWKPLAESTKRQRKSKGFGEGPILSRTGNLQDEITSMKANLSKGFNSVVASWGIDNLRGEEKTKFAAHQLGEGKSGQNLPKRTMIQIAERDVENLERSLNNWLYRQFK